MACANITIHGLLYSLNDTLFPVLAYSGKRNIDALYINTSYQFDSSIISKICRINDIQL